jgi:hypothetical protein
MENGRRTNRAQVKRKRNYDNLPTLIVYDPTSPNLNIMNMGVEIHEPVGIGH